MKRLSPDAPKWLLRVGILFSSLLFAGTAFPIELPALSVSSAQESDIVDRYLSASLAQQSALRGVPMEVEIDASVPKLKRAGKLRALRKISQIGAVTYRMLGFAGDNSVKKEVIARYLSAEVQAQAGPSLSINRENYKFKYKGVREADGHPAYLLSLAPRKNEVGLFKGELWLDQATCMPIRESGRFVKNPSVFLKKMEFVRFYDLHDGVSIPRRTVSSVSTRLFGPVQLSIRFTNFAKEAEPEKVAGLVLGGFQR